MSWYINPVDVSTIFLELVKIKMECENLVEMNTQNKPNNESTHLT